ncbi:MAG: sporulation protein YtfJ [Ruminococcus sp.]|jgi:sporulation protein YtfJ|nr:sporulation protein YtfJ [Ruminococcus sp.]
MSDQSKDAKVKELIETSLGKIHELSDADTVVGNPINGGNGITIIPISKVSYGFAAGGSDLPTKTDKTYFGGASGGGITILPLAFIVISGSDVKLLQITEESSAVGAIAMIPELIVKIKDMFKKDKKKETSEEDIFSDDETE